MTYFNDSKVAVEKSPFAVHEVCMCCGKPSAGPTVAYDLILPGSENIDRILFHRDCAFEMAQRIICDAWPNRRDKAAIENQIE